MRAYKGLVKDGKIVLAEEVKLPEGAVVTVTISEAEYIRAKLQDTLKQNTVRRSNINPTPAYTSLGATDDKYNPSS